MNESKTIRSKALSNIIPKETLREVQLETLDRVANALANSYGPDGSTTLIRTGSDEKETGRSAYTKDGHRILQGIKFSKPIEISILDDLKQITTNTVKTVGDGTTSAIILSNEIFKSLYKLSKSEKYSDKYLVKELNTIVKVICDIIDSHKRECTLDDIFTIALTSTDGNKAVARAIYDLYDDLGMGAYIDVNISNTPKSMVKVYDGITVDAGYFNANFINNPQKALAEFDKPNIYIFEDPIDTPEMLNFCYKIIEDNLLNPLVQFNALMADYQTNGSSKIKEDGDKALASLKPTVIFAPAFGRDIRSKMDQILQMMQEAKPEQRAPLLLIPNVSKPEQLSDLSVLCGAKMIKKYINPKAQEEDIKRGLAPTMETISKWFGGRADRVSADMNTTKIINPALMYDSDHKYTTTYTSLIESLEAQLSQYEDTKTDITEMHILRKRIQSLKCNMAEYFVGGIAYTDRDALKDSVEDAVLNCRNAVENGVGYGANFEGLRAITFLNSNKEKSFRLSNGELFSKDDFDEDVLLAIQDAYESTVARIYNSYAASKDIDINDLIYTMLADQKPINISMNAEVLTSIKTDQTALNAISKIIGLMFKTNQFICSTPNYNTYTEF